jgi:hypothetical protein
VKREEKRGKIEIKISETVRKEEAAGK